MIKSMLVSLGLGALWLQPAHADAPKPGTEQVGKDESLQKGGDDRPWATGVSQAEQKAALGLFQQANAQLNDGLFGKAAEIYRDALTHWSHPAIHYNLALALMNLNEPVEVFEHLTKSIAFGAAPLEKDKFDRAKEYLVVYEKTIAEIEVSCDKPGAKVLVDGKEVFVAPGKYTGKVKVGKHTFIAQKEGYEARVKAPSIGPGDHFRIELKLFTAEELTRYHRRWENTWFPYAIVGGGAVAGIVGGVLELSAKSSFDKFDKAVASCNTGSPGGNSGCSAHAYDGIKNAATTKRTIGYVGYGVAGAAIASGLGLAWFNRRQPYQIRAEDLQQEQDKEPEAMIVPVVSPDLTGAMVMGHF
jgi:hypothetical protein